MIFYLVLNYKNRTFLGDGGAYLLSFILSLFFINRYNSNYIFADHVLIFMLYPGLEIIRLFFLRLLKNHHPFRADREHLHHYLLKKYSFFVTFFFIQFLIVVPIFLYFCNFKILSFIYGIFAYLFTIIITIFILKELFKF